MSNWKYKVDISSDYAKCKEGEMSVEETAREVEKKLRVAMTTSRP